MEAAKKDASEDQVCPLCMEQIEFDDLSFFPCQCGYQICRFCWHRIRTNENGLCPACRKVYPASPDRFQPCSVEETKQHKKNLNMKKKNTENSRRKLSELRVIQKNLIFVTGLSLKITHMEELKKPIYFGKYGKILKIFVSSNGVSGCAYITYSRQLEALRAIQGTNNIVFDSKTIKSSLGTTKYCINFIKYLQCNKTECMYLHSLGEEQASFTKEDMMAGKHTDYEKRLLTEYIEHEKTAKQNAILGTLSPIPIASMHVKARTRSVAEVVKVSPKEVKEAPIKPQPLPLPLPLPLLNPNPEVPEYPDEEKFDPFKDTNKLFEDLISMHTQKNFDKDDLRGISLFDPPVHNNAAILPYGSSQFSQFAAISGQPGFSNWMTNNENDYTSNGYNAGLQSGQPNDLNDPAILFAQINHQQLQFPQAQWGMGNGLNTSLHSGMHTTPLNGQHTTPLNGQHTLFQNTPQRSILNGPQTSFQNGPYSTFQTGPYTSVQNGPFTSPQNGPFTSPQNGPFTTPQNGPFTTPQNEPFTTPQNGPFNSLQNGPFTTPQNGPFTTPHNGPYTTVQNGHFF